MNRFVKAFKSFYCAGRGIAYCLRHERHLRIHIVVAAYVLYFATFYGFTRGEYALIVLTCSAVIAAEIMNTSIEVVIDKVSPRYNMFALIGKDIAAGAVLTTAIGAVCVGVFMLWDIDVFAKIFTYFTENIIRPLILLAVTALSIWFIASAKPRKTGNKRKKDTKND